MGNLFIDKKSGKVLVRNQEISLNPKEFEILWMLASKPRYIYSTDELINAIFRLGMVVKEKSFIDRVQQNIQQKTGFSFIQKIKENQYRFHSPIS